MIATIYQSRSSNAQTISKFISKKAAQTSNGKPSTEVVGLDANKTILLSTNVPYSDDAEMQGLLVKRGKDLVSQLEPYSTQYINGSHSLPESLGLCNLNDGDILIVDSFNLYVSNLWLRNNSCTVDLLLKIAEPEIKQIARALKELNEKGNLIVILTSDVSLELGLHTVDICQYSDIITAVNAMLERNLHEMDCENEIHYSGVAITQAVYLSKWKYI